MSAQRPWRSGWCGRDAAAWQHARCRGRTDTGTSCSCECHRSGPTPAVAQPVRTSSPQRSAVVLLQALDVLEAATSAVSPDLAIEPVRKALASLDDDQVRAVAVALAVEAVWKFPLALVEPSYAGNVRLRVQQVRSWVRRMRLEAAWLAS